MAFKDILLQLTSYPEPTPVAAVDRALRIVQAMGAHVTALTFEMVMRLPGSALTPRLIGVKGALEAEQRKSADNARTLIDAFENTARDCGVQHEHIIELCEAAHVPGIVADYARLSDVTIVPVGDDVTYQQSIAETVIFGSGRPTMVLPAGPNAAFSGAFDVIGVAWDFSRPAARAVADALPLLQRAKSVRVVTVTEEKPIETRRSGAELARHLAFHGIEVVPDSESAAGRPVGQVLADYTNARRLDLLVMGAYGHSRVREFILGGATRSILDCPPAPVLLSH